MFVKGMIVKWRANGFKMKMFGGFSIDENAWWASGECIGDEEDGQVLIAAPFIFGNGERIVILCPTNMLTETSKEEIERLNKEEIDRLNG